MKILNWAAPLLIAASAFATATPASAVDVHNCTRSKLKILVFNQNDKFESVHKAKILLAVGGSNTKVKIPGKNYHKFKIFKRGVLDNHLGTIRGIDENKSYKVVGAGNGAVAMKVASGC